jgi:ubiquinone/menaquinone biosynthesis C-methylase UbiE/uncharacterized protein YbaR (Trm112 family)
MSQERSMLCEVPLLTADVELLRCPDCSGALDLRDQCLLCASCGALWPVSEGWPRLYREDEVRGTDRLMRVFYDGLPRLHDPLTRYLLPALQTEGSERAMRLRYRERMALEALAPRPDGQPLRILEVGIGCGANLPLILEALPEDLDVEIWGVDLSVGMMLECRRRQLWRRRPRGRGRARVHLAVADAHALPFADHSFDRVFHVGAAGSWRDPGRALAELARVARPNTPIVVVDEQLDPERPGNLYHRLTFAALTFYDHDPHSPVELLPPGAADVTSEQVSRFYYCLTFSMPGQQARAAA